MNYIIYKDINKSLKRLIKSLKTEIIQRLMFSSNKYKSRFRSNQRAYYKNGKNNTIHISNSSSIYREWITYSAEAALSKDIGVKIANKYIKFIRIIFPYGIRSNKEFDLHLTIDNSQEDAKIKRMDINKNLSIKARDIKYFRNLFHIDIEVNNIIKNISIKKQHSPLTFQSIEKIKSKPIKTIYIILDAIDHENFIKSKGYINYLKNEESYTYKTFAPSTVTGSSLPSLITLQPVLTHMIGDYKQWFYSSKLESLPAEIKTIAEIIKHKSEYSEAYTSFSKSMPFYNYYRGFNIYNSRCTGNNYSPSAIDLLNINLLENTYFYSKLNSYFLFAHDIGGHPPVSPSIDFSQNPINFTKNSYKHSIEISLNKVNSLINHLKATHQFENTNLIITSDHTESSPEFSKDKYHLNPRRIEVPIYMKPAKNLNNKELEIINNNEKILPSSYLLAKLISIIYSLNIDHPKYSFDNIYWLSSVYKYPERKYIYTLGFDNINQLYMTVKIKTSILKNLDNIYTLEDVSIYLLKDNKLTDTFTNIEKNRIRNSFSSYVQSCRRDKYLPIKQGDHIFR